MAYERLVKALLLAAWILLNGAWLAEDRRVRDGDEEGHVGAAELFLEDGRQGQWGQALARLGWMDMGEYPSLYPASVAGWWAAAGGGQPGRAAVRAVGLAWLALAALGTAGAARRLGADGARAGLAVLWLPLLSGLGRHFMPEIALVAWAALATWAALEQRHQPTPGRALVLGLTLGAGLLTKQTFPLMVLHLPFIVAWTPSLAAGLLGVALAAPWALNNAQEQLAYLRASADYESEGNPILYYPLVLAVGGLGPVWLGLGALGLRRDRRSAVALGWLGLGLLALTATPKKYDRLAAPLLPAVGLAAAALPAPALALGAAWTAWTSLRESTFNQPTEWEARFHPGCVQRWQRAPQPDDLGFGVVAAEAARRGARTLRVLEAPEIPCAVSTTFPWADHLGPWLRREGLEVRLVEEGAADLTVDWSGGPHLCPALGRSFALH